MLSTRSIQRYDFYGDGAGVGTIGPIEMVWDGACGGRGEATISHS